MFFGRNNMSDTHVACLNSCIGSHGWKLFTRAEGSQLWIQGKLFCMSDIHTFHVSSPRAMGCLILQHLYCFLEFSNFAEFVRGFTRAKTFVPHFQLLPWRWQAPDTQVMALIEYNPVSLTDPCIFIVSNGVQSTAFGRKCFKYHDCASRSDSA